MMTFVTNPRDYHHYFTTTTTDFQAAVQPFTMRAGTSLHSTCVCVCVCGWVGVGVCVCVCGLRCSYKLIVTHVWNNILFYKRLSFLILILGTHTALQVTRSVYILVPDPPLPTHTHHTTQPVCLVCSHLTRPLHTHTHTAGVPAQSFFKHHSAIHDTIKGQLIPSYLTSMCPSLSAEFNNSLSCHGNSGEAELMDFVRDPMFEAVVRQLFGKENVPSTRVGCMCGCGLKYFCTLNQAKK